MEAFETARLTATRLAAEDLDDLVRLHLDPEVSRFLGGIRSPESTAVYLDTNLQHWTDHGFGLWTLRTPDIGFVGRAGLRYIDLEGAQELEIAYTLVKPPGAEVWPARSPAPWSRSGRRAWQLRV